jgi:nitrogen fixation-related uncharacterized protein
MNDLSNVIFINLLVIIIGLVAYLWGVATKEARYEDEIKKLRKQRHVSPAVREYLESR